MARRGKEDDDLAFQLLANLCRDADSISEKLKAMPLDNGVSHPLGYILRGEGAGLSIRPWIALLQLFNRPYFSRTWIALDITLARQAEVRCGEYYMLWYNLARTFQFICEYDIVFQGLPQFAA